MKIRRKSLQSQNQNRNSAMTKMIFGAGCFMTLIGLVVVVFYPFLPVDLLMRIHDAVTGNPIKRLFVPGTGIEYLVASPELIAAFDLLLIIPFGMTAAGLAVAFVGFWLRIRFERADQNLELRSASVIHRSPVTIGREQSPARRSEHAQE